MHGTNETLLGHIENFDALSTNVDEQIFKDFGQGAGVGMLDDTSKTGTAEWIKTYWTLIVGIAGGVLLAVLSIAFVIWAKKKLNRLEKGAQNFKNNAECKLKNKSIVGKKRNQTIKYIKSEQLNNAVSCFDKVEKILNDCIEQMPQQKCDENIETRSLVDALNELNNRLTLLHKVTGVKFNLNVLISKAAVFFENKSADTATVFGNIDFAKLKSTPDSQSEPLVPKKEKDGENTSALKIAFTEIRSEFLNIRNEFNSVVNKAKNERPGILSRVFMPDFTKKTNQKILKEYSDVPFSSFIEDAEPLSDIVEHPNFI